MNSKGFFYEDNEKLEKANPRAEEIEKEIRAQIGKVRTSGLHFVYLDWHRGVPHIVRDIVIKLCREQQLIYGQGMEGSVYGYSHISLQPASVVVKQTLPDGQIVHYAAPAFSEELKQTYFDLLSGIEPGRYWSNIHPGLVGGAKSDLTELICDPRIWKIVKKRNIQLVSYYDLWEEVYGSTK